MKPSAQGMYLEIFCDVMPEPMTTGNTCQFFYAPQFFQSGRFSGSRSRDNDAVDEKELCLLDDISDVKICVSACEQCFLFTSAKILMCPQPSSRPFSEQSACAAFDQAGAANMRENVAFHSKKIEIGLAGDLQRGLIGGFEHLDADRTVEAISRLFGDAFHQVDGREDPAAA